MAIETAYNLRVFFIIVDSVVADNHSVRPCYGHNKVNQCTTLFNNMLLIYSYVWVPAIDNGCCFGRHF